MYLLSLRGIGLEIDEQTILRNVNLNVAEGEIVGLIGPNGSGKTTLFNIISGFLKPTVAGKYLPVPLSPMKKLPAALLAASLTLAACQPVVPDANEPLKIGLVGPLTGESALLGSDALTGARRKAAELNADGARKVKILAEDGRCTRTDAVGAAQKLIMVDEVDAIVVVCSEEEAAIAPLAAAAGLPFISLEMTGEGENMEDLAYERAGALLETLFPAR